MREIEFKPSRRLGLLLLGMTALALLAIWLAVLPAGIRLALGMTATGLAAWHWRRMSRREILRITPDGQLQNMDGQNPDDEGNWRDAEMLGDSFVSTALIVLRYRAAGGQVRSLTLLPDSADADDLRRLRVSLRWARRTRSDTSFPDAG